MKREDAASSAANNPAGRGGAAVVGRLRCGRRQLDILAAVAAGDRVAVPVLPGAAGWGLHGAVPLVAAAAAAAAAAAVVSGCVPAGSGVLAVGGVRRQQSGGMAAAARCVLCFLGAFAVTRSQMPLPWMDVSVVVQFRY